MTGTQFKAARQAAGLSQQALADACGMYRAQIQKLEGGTSKIDNVTLKNALALADALGVDIHELMGCDEVPNDTKQAIGHQTYNTRGTR